MQTSRDSGPPESTTDVAKVGGGPGYRRPGTTKFVRSHNKDEVANKSAQGHYLQRDGSMGKKRDSQFGPDTEYQYKYVTLSKEEEDDEYGEEEEP